VHFVLLSAVSINLLFLVYGCIILFIANATLF
jgi:hypothetical protein